MHSNFQPHGPILTLFVSLIAKSNIESLVRSSFRIKLYKQPQTDDLYHFENMKYIYGTKSSSEHIMKIAAILMGRFQDAVLQSSLKR